MISRLAATSLLLAEAMVAATFAEFLAATYSGNMPHAVAAWAFAVTVLAGFAVPRFIEGFELSAGKAYAITGAAGLLLIYALTRITVVGDIAIWDLGWISDFLSDSQDAAQRGGHAVVGATLLLVVWARANIRAAKGVNNVPKLAITSWFIVAVGWTARNAATSDTLRKCSTKMASIEFITTVTRSEVSNGIVKAKTSRHGIDSVRMLKCSNRCCSCSKRWIKAIQMTIPTMVAAK